MKDRQPTQPGRVKLTRADGTVEYVTIERADEPTEVGTPLNKATLLSDETSSLIGLESEDPTVNDALSALWNGKLGPQGTAGAAKKLETARTIQTDLSSTAAASFDGSENVKPGVTGTLPLVKGGTNGTTAAAALYNLINGATALTASGLATGDVLGLGDVSAATGKKLTIANLITYLKNNSGLAQIATGSYTGTGTYGASNPCSLTFDFVPKLVLITPREKDSTYRGFFFCFALTSSYVSNGYVNGRLGLYDTSSYAKVSGETLSWYSTDYYNAQFNDKMTYYYIAIG